eukprot:671126-Alexandrium_andersonii.AAC.2
MLNAMPGVERRSVLREGRGSSGQTFAALADILGRHESLVVWIGENTEELSRGASDNRLYLFERLGDMGWIAESLYLDSSHYGARTARARSWVIALAYARLGMTPEEAQAILDKMTATIRGLTIGKLPMQAFLLDADDEIAEAELQRQQVASVADPAPPSASSARSSKAKDKETDWRTDFVAVLEKHRIR